MKSAAYGIKTPWTQKTKDAPKNKSSKRSAFCGSSFCGQRRHLEAVDRIRGLDHEPLTTVYYAVQTTKTYYLSTFVKKK